MKKNLFSLLTLLTCCSIVYAQRFSVTDFSVPQNSEGTLYVSFEFDTEDMYTGYAFYLELPSEFEFVMAEGSDVAYTIGECHDTSHSVTANLSDGIVKVAGLSLSSKPLKGTSGILLTFAVRSASLTLTVGQTYTGIISNILLVSIDGTKQSISGSNFTITAVAPTDTRTVLDEASTTAPVAEANANVRVRRTIKAGEWSTICLPFAMTEAQCKEAFGSDVQIAEFTGAESEFDDADNVVGITVSFSDVSAIEANTPYIIKVGEAVSEFTVDGVDITPDEDEAYVEFDNGKTGSRRVVYSGFYGTYHAGTVLDENTLFLSDNQFWYSAGLTRMKAFRAYFDFLDVLTEVEEAQARILLSFGDGGTTGVGDALRLMNNGRVNSEESASAVYNLKGQRVAQPSKGLYIKDGRKVVVK